MNFSHRLTAALAFGWILAVNSTLTKSKQAPSFHGGVPWTDTTTAQPLLEVSQLSQQRSLTPQQLNGSSLLDENGLLVGIHGLYFDERGRVINKQSFS